MWLKDDLDRMFNTDRYERIFYNDNEIIFIICEGKFDVFAIKNNINVKERYFEIVEKLTGTSMLTKHIYYACMEHMDCGCSNPFHTIFETKDLKEAVYWVNQSPLKRKYQGYDK